MKKVKSEDRSIYSVESSTREEENKIIEKAKEICLRRMKHTGILFNSPGNVQDYIKLAYSGYEFEVFVCFFLSTRNELIAHEIMFTGTIDGCSVYTREIVKKALKYNSNSIIFVHNHPSGVSEPSNADKQITKRLQDALHLVDIRVLDHFIVGNKIYSFAENGLM